jgi:hypothetical protein
LTTVDDYLPQGQPMAERTSGHEANTLRVRTLIGSAAALVAVGILVEIVLAFVMMGFSSEEKDPRALAPPRFAGDTGGFPDPRLQSDPAVELLKMQQEDLSQLNGYGWVDRKAGIAHIPIERAIDILAASGLPVPPAAPAGSEAPAAAKPARALDPQSRPDSKQDRKP